MKRILLILLIVVSSISSIAQSPIPMGLLGCDINNSVHELKMHLIKEKGFEIDFNENLHKIYKNTMHSTIASRIALIFEHAGVNINEEDIFVSGLEFDLLNGSFDNTLDCSIAMQSINDKIVMIIVRCYLETDNDRRAFHKIENLYKNKYGEGAVNLNHYLNEYDGKLWEILVTEDTILYFNFKDAVDAYKNHKTDTLMI